MVKEMIIKYKNVIILTIGTILIILSLCLLLYDKIVLLKSSVYDEVELEKYRENNRYNNTNTESEPEKDETVPADALEVNTEKNDEEEKPNTTSSKSAFEKDIIGYLEIKKINLRQGLVSKKSYYNNINRNIQILDASDYPDKEAGNVILVAHSGTSSISYFKHLYQLTLGDEAKIYYKNYVYTYQIKNIYNVEKNGSVKIVRDSTKQTLTLITCTKNSNTEQTVYILELMNKESEE